MKRYLFFFACLLLSACSSLPPAIENAPSVDITYDQASKNINNYKDAQVRWGGVIIDLQNEQSYSMLQILSYPLNSYGRPLPNNSYHGRFLVVTPEFLDPTVYVKGKEITAAGMLNGDSERVIGNKTLRLPIIAANIIHLWPDYEPANYYYGGFGYGYYPYYGYSPFYWGSFYRPFPPY